MNSIIDLSETALFLQKLEQKIIEIFVANFWFIPIQEETSNEENFNNQVNSYESFNNQINSFVENELLNWLLKPEENNTFITFDVKKQILELAVDHFLSFHKMFKEKTIHKGYENIYEITTKYRKFSFILDESDRLLKDYHKKITFLENITENFSKNSKNKWTIGK